MLCTQWLERTERDHPLRWPLMCWLVFCHVPDYRERSLRLATVRQLVQVLCCPQEAHDVPSHRNAMQEQLPAVVECVQTALCAQPEETIAALPECGVPPTPPHPYLIVTFSPAGMPLDPARMISRVGRCLRWVRGMPRGIKRSTTAVGCAESLSSEPWCVGG